jgi:hypothetical protein
MSDTTGTQGPDPDGMDVLVSAYLDGEVTPEERSQIEADPTLLTEVERLRQVRAVLGATTEPPPISVREAHLAAALDVWDRMPETERSGEVTPSAGMDAAAAAAISTPTSLSSRRDRRSRRGSTKWLLGAAAGLAVIAGGGLVLRSLVADDGTESTAEDSSAEAATERAESEDEVVAEMAAEEFAGDDAESAPAEVNPDDVASEDNLTAAAEPAMDAPAEEPAEEEASAGEAPVEEAPEDAGIFSDDAEDPAPAEIDLEALETPSDLADFGAFAFYAGGDTDAPPGPDFDPPFNTCEVEFAGTFQFDTFAGKARYQGQEVVVAVDGAANPPSVVAFTELCEFIASAPLPPEDVFAQRLVDEQSQP